MKRTDAQSIGTLIERFIDSSGSRDNYDAQRICYLWSEVMGPTINRHTVRRWVDAGTLHVIITSAPLKSELGMIRSKIVERLNEAAGKNVINDIAFH
ncbi:MAG: DUF721 domain-containing protein [Muribaculaceae bacterium]|nr:DUF721 domain-containing protein [Muribaculaceae bacterium]